MNDSQDPMAENLMDEESMEHLLRLAGARPTMPAERLARVREGVHRHWLDASRRRTIRRRLLIATAFAAAATIVVAVWGVATPDRRAVVAEPVVAVVNQVEGAPLASASIRAGEWVETNAGARIGLRTLEGTSVRLDAGSRARLLSEGVIEIARGALYLDSGRERGGVEVRTPLGTVRDVGTQFEVRLVGEQVRVSVRSGKVELRDANRAVMADAGTEVLLSTANVEQRPISVHGPRWEWTTRVAPRLEIGGRTLSAVLEEIARECGWRIRYADRDLAREASVIVLHGSLAGLRPLDALEVATATSAFGYRLEEGHLVIFRRAAVR